MLSADDIAQLRRLMELREERDSLKVASDNAKKAYQEAEADLYEQLADGPVSRLNNVDLGEPWGRVSFGSRETYYGRVIDEDAAIQHYTARAAVEQMTEPKFAMKRLNEEVRDCIEQGKPLPPGVDWYARRGVTITRQKGS